MSRAAHAMGFWHSIFPCGPFRIDCLPWTTRLLYPTEGPSYVCKQDLGLIVSFYPAILIVASDLLCPLLTKSFGPDIKCISPEHTFTGPSIISERFASSSAYQYYEDISSLSDLVLYIQQTICANDQSCKIKADALESADYLDVDYDTISQSLVVSAFWHAGTLFGKWDELFDNRNGSVTTEVGILANQKPTNSGELSLRGFLVVLGEDEKLSMKCDRRLCPSHPLTLSGPTLFSFPSRHHLSSSASGATYSTAFRHPTGLHPTLRLTLPSSMKSPSPECALHTYLTLPSYLFVDKYQLSSPNLLTSNNLHLVRSLSGEADLEAPDWAIGKWGSTLLLELAPPELVGSYDSGGSWNADIPLHLRNLPPSSGQCSQNCSSTPEISESSRLTGEQRSLLVPWPIVFWACSTDEGTKMNTNPFDRVNLGYEGLFGPRTLFYHLQPSSHGRPMKEAVEAPVMKAKGAEWVEIGTVVIVSWGFLWICANLVGVMTKGLHWSGATVRKKKD